MHLEFEGITLEMGHHHHHHEFLRSSQKASEAYHERDLISKNPGFMDVTFWQYGCDWYNISDV